MGRESAMTVKIVQNWLPESKYYLKASYDMQPKGIIVHNTAGAASAMEEANRMINNNSPISFHVVIDEKEVVECIPFRRNAWHAGDGGYGFANRNLIGIEIARSTSPQEVYLQAEANAVIYVAGVLKEYGWGVDKLYKHKQFSATACPHRTEELGWQRFIALVQAELNRLKKPSESKPKVVVPSPYQKDADKLKKLGLTTGERLNDNLKRGEFFSILNKTLEYLDKKGE